MTRFEMGDLMSVVAAVEAPRPKVAVGEILGSTFGVIGQRAAALGMLASLWVFLPQLLVSFLPDEMSRGAVIANVPALIFDGAAALLTIRQLTGAAISAKDAQRAGLHNFGKLWTVGLLSGLAIVLGTVLLIVPGVILIAGWMPATAVLMAEGKTGRDCLKRAWELTRGSRWRLAGLFGVVLLASLIVLAVFIGIVIAEWPRPTKRRPRSCLTCLAPSSCRCSRSSASSAHRRSTSASPRPRRASPATSPRSSPRLYSAAAAVTACGRRLSNRPSAARSSLAFRVISSPSPSERSSTRPCR